MIKEQSSGIVMSTMSETNFREKKSVPLCEEYKIDLEQAATKPISSICFGSFENSFDILACSTHERVFVYRVMFEDENSENKFSYQLLHDYICGSKCSTLAIGPKTKFILPDEGYLSFAVATVDFSILVLNQLISQDSEEAAEQLFFTGHISYINDMAFEPISGDQLASTGDDCTCIIRSLTNQQNSDDEEIRIMLTSPGMNVKWHKTEPNKLFIAEKKGVIRFYDTVTAVAVMSFDCNRYPLVSSDWCFENSVFIGCAANKDLFFWDTSLTSLPIKIMKTNSEGLLEFAFYDYRMVAYRGRPNKFLSVRNFYTNQVYIEKEFIAGRGLSWSRRMPLLAVGGPKFIHLYKFNVC